MVQSIPAKINAARVAGRVDLGCADTDVRRIRTLTPDSQRKYAPYEPEALLSPCFQHGVGKTASIAARR